jgi:hypothetical protein
MSLPTWTELQNYRENPSNSAYNAYVGWNNTSAGDCGVDTLFAGETIEAISEAVTRALQGVDPQQKQIVVAPDKIVNVLSNMYQNSTRPQIGDIHSRYIIPQAQPRCDLRSIINQTINVIVRSIRDEIETTENNKKLSVWSTVYGDFNKEGLRAHAPIKIRRRHPQYMAFNMKY